MAARAHTTNTCVLRAAAAVIVVIAAGLFLSMLGAMGLFGLGQFFAAVGGGDEGFDGRILGQVIEIVAPAVAVLLGFGGLFVVAALLGRWPGLRGGVVFGLGVVGLASMVLGGALLWSLTTNPVLIAILLAWFGWPAVTLLREGRHLAHPG